MAQTLLETTLAAAKRDVALVRSDGTSHRRLTQDVVIRRLVTHVDERGSVTELYDPRWDAHAAPLVFSYICSIRPRVAKGWSLHREHDDRYCLLFGEMALLLYDVREGSTTYGELCRIVLHERDRCLVTIPRNVWHADHNIGTQDVVFANFPTVAYNHEHPDKYRLPLETDIIPHRFPEGTVGE